MLQRHRPYILSPGKLKHNAPGESVSPLVLSQGVKTSFEKSSVGGFGIPSPPRQGRSLNLIHPLHIKEKPSLFSKKPLLGLLFGNLDAHTREWYLNKAGRHKVANHYSSLLPRTTTKLTPSAHAPVPFGTAPPIHRPGLRRRFPATRLCGSKHQQQ